MKKDKYGIYLGFYTALSFIFVLLGYTELTVLLLGFVIVVQKDRWCVMQVMQALFLVLLSDLVEAVGNLLHGADAFPFLAETVFVYWDVLSFIINVFIFALAAAGLLRNIRGADAGLPFFRRAAEKAFGLVRVVTYHEMNDKDRAEEEKAEKRAEKIQEMMVKAEQKVEKIKEELKRKEERIREKESVEKREDRTEKTEDKIRKREERAEPTEKQEQETEEKIEKRENSQGTEKQWEQIEEGNEKTEEAAERTEEGMEAQTEEQRQFIEPIGEWPESEPHIPNI